MAKEIFNNLYYDIESLKDIFSLAAFNEKTCELDIYYLLDSRILNNQSFSAAFEQEAAAEIYAKNKNFAITNGKINFYNLYEESASVRLAKTFGCYAPDMIQNDYNFPLVCDIDPDFDEDKHPYLMGYNSLNYDTTMLSEYFYEVFPLKYPKGSVFAGQKDPFKPTTPMVMRKFNDELFAPEFKGNMPDRLKYVYEIDPAKQRDFSLVHIGNMYLRNEGKTPSSAAFYIRRYMINSGRHIDVAKLNEKQVKVALKRLLGMSGYQILESDTDLSSRGDTDNAGEDKVMTLDEIKSLLAYNVSDVINLKELFHDKNYLATFKLKKQLLIDYPELIYDQVETVKGTTKVNKYNRDTGRWEMMDVPATVKEYKPDIKPEKIKKNRLTINSSSAQLAAACLCPYGHLDDSPVVSFMYPSEKKAKELGIPRVNVLDETVKFIETRLKPRVKDAEGQEIIDELYKMVDMYRNIEGKDFNATHAPDNPEFISDLKNFSDKINVPYMDPDGHAADCYVTFSVGGLHGAQYNLPLYKKHLAEYEERQNLFKKVVEKYGDANNVLLDVNEKGKVCKRKFVEIDGVQYPISIFVKSTDTIKKAQAGEVEFKPEFTSPKKPTIFKKAKKSNSGDGTALDKKYVITSFGPMNHEDFTSYYPSMLINMSAFWNDGLGYDRYAEIFGNKEKFGKLMKDKSYSQSERDLYSVMRNGTKLILNSASGAADVTLYNTSIRMNNNITAMRIIGQLFTWRIGQAQSLEGAKVVSTNTDGLYTIFDPEENEKILNREAQDIHVGIEPEPIFVVSKDANNRWEGEVKGHTGNATLDIDITAASGGTLACMYGPNTAKALAHPAIMDWALAEFLKWKALCGNLDDYDANAVRYLLTEVAPTVFKNKETGEPDRRKLLQMYQNVIASNPNNGTYNFATRVPVTDENEFTVDPIFMQHYNRVFYVDPKKVPEEYRKNIVYLQAAYIRGERTDNSPLAIRVIRDLNNDKEALLKGTAKLKKINGIENNTPCIICNEDLAYTDKIQLDWLDLEYYNAVLKGTYDKNWKNNLAGDVIETDEEDDEED